VQTLSEIRQLFADRGLRPRHRLGQNFLHDHNQLRKLVAAADLAPGALVLEVGPGTGTLTEALLDAGAEVLACELDGDMAAIVSERLGSRITLIRGDALAGQRELHPHIITALAGRSFKLVANLPYQIASALISTLLIDHPRCEGQFVTIQKEVAQRLAATPSTPAYGSLSVIVQALARVRPIATLSPGCFWPEPEVTSAMVAVLPEHDTGATLLADRGRARDFARFVTSLFTMRRKQLGGILGRGSAVWTAVAAAGVTPDLRPEALAPAQFVALWQAERALGEASSTGSR
jgi:16S rRNA (adenine1518-N6/adenine1519-N6)-dimethyltransferase